MVGPLCPWWHRAGARCMPPPRGSAPACQGGLWAAAFAFLILPLIDHETSHLYSTKQQFLTRIRSSDSLLKVKYSLATTEYRKYRLSARSNYSKPKD